MGPLLLRFFSSEGSRLNSEVRSSIDILHDLKALLAFTSFVWPLW